MGRTTGAIARRLIVVASLLSSGAAAEGGAPFDAMPGTSLPDGSNTDASGQCTSSGECAPPLPYCQPFTHTCVQCLSTRNCVAGKFCEGATGTCASCRADDDCPSERPYCAGTEGCVECKSDANCASYGVACYDGKCGRCGDGVCGPHEKILDDGLGLGGPRYDPFTPPVPPESCAKDCASRCPSLKAQLNEPLEFEYGAADDWDLGCGDCKRPDVSIEFTATRAGNLHFLLEPLSGVDAYSAGIFEGGCLGFPGGRGDLPNSLQVVSGQTSVLVLDFFGAGKARLTISDRLPSCRNGVCTDAGSSDLGKAACLAGAKSRGDPTCGGVGCACEHCPQNYGDCSLIPGCMDVLACMREAACVGEACTAPCGRIAEPHGGVKGRAFEAASELQSCALTFSCALPCGDSRGAVDAGFTDAGAVCTRGVVTSCACDGGTGERTCAADGSGFGDCACTAPKHADSGCGCEVGRRSPERPSLALIAGAALAAGFSMRKRARQGASKGWWVR
jgi:hypothetical protein